jgi:hypothetical protein
MTKSPRLEAYMAIEQAALALDGVEDELVAALRNVLDPLWYRLTDEERDSLNRRFSKQEGSS